MIFHTFLNFLFFIKNYLIQLYLYQFQLTNKSIPSITSIMIYFLITLYLIFLLIKVFQKTEITPFQNTIFRDLYIDSSEHFFNESSPKLAFKWFLSDIGDSSAFIGSFDMFQFHTFMNPNNTYDETYDNITVPIWNPELFPLGSFMMDFYKENYYNNILNYNENNKLKMISMLYINLL